MPQEFREQSKHYKVRDLGIYYKGTILRYYLIQFSLKLFKVGTLLIPIQLREAKWSRGKGQQMAVPEFKSWSTFLQAQALKSSAIKAFELRGYWGSEQHE